MDERGDAPDAALKRACRDAGRGAAAAGAVGLFASLLHLAGPLFMIQVYDRVIPSHSFETLVGLAILAGTVLIFQACLDYLRHRVFMVLAERFVLRLGPKALQAGVERALAEPGADATGVMRDLFDIRGFIAGGAAALPLELLAAPLFLAVLYLMHPVYGLVGLFAAVAMTLVALLIERVARRPMTTASRRVQSVQSEAGAAVRQAEVVEAMGMLPNLVRRWHEAQAEAMASLSGSQARARSLSVVGKTLRSALQLTVVGTGAVLVIHGEVSAGTLIAASVILGRALLPFEGLMDGLRQWADASASFQRLRDVVVESGAQRETVPIGITGADLTADGLWFIPAGRKRPVLRNVSFNLEGGELLGVVGPSGSGKSTLARMLVGAAPPSNGGVFLDGHNVRIHERTSFGRAVGYLPQDPALLHASIAENIARLDRPDMAAVIRAATVAGVHELIGTLPRGYQTLVSEGSAILSGGQRQRIALARALYGEPKLLVLDEPNSSLDAAGESALIQAVEQARGRGATVVIVAQRMSILRRATKLLVLGEGAVTHYGEREDVLAQLSKSERRASPAVATLPRADAR